MINSEEYKIQPTNTGLLQDIASRTGGQVVSSPDQVMRNIDYESSKS